MRALECVSVTAKGSARACAEHSDSHAVTAIDAGEKLATLLYQNCSNDRIRRGQCPLRPRAREGETRAHAVPRRHQEALVNQWSLRRFLARPCRRCANRN